MNNNLWTSLKQDCHYTLKVVSKLMSVMRVTDINFGLNHAMLFSQAKLPYRSDRLF